VGSVTPDGCCPTQTANTGHLTTQLNTVTMGVAGHVPCSPQLTVRAVSDGL
jgi:hypothetical protein